MRRPVDVPRDTSGTSRSPRGPPAVGLRCRDRTLPEIQVVPVDVDGHPAPCLVMTTMVLLHPSARPPAVLAEVRRWRCPPAVPPRDPDAVGEHDQAGPLDPGVVERLDAGADGGVDAGDVAELVQPGRPAAEEPQRRLAAVRVGDVEALEVVPQRAARRGCRAPGRRSPSSRPRRALGERRGVRLVGAGRRVDLHVVVVAREPRLAAGLRAQGDRQQPPAVRELRADPGRGQVRLLAAGAGLAGDVDARGQERRGLAASCSWPSGSAPGTGRSRSR